MNSQLSSKSGAQREKSGKSRNKRNKLRNGEVTAIFSHWRTHLLSSAAVLGARYRPILRRSLSVCLFLSSFLPQIIKIYAFSLKQHQLLSFLFHKKISKTSIKIKQQTKWNYYYVWINLWCAFFIYLWSEFNIGFFFQLSLGSCNEWINLVIIFFHYFYYIKQIVWASFNELIIMLDHKV